VINAGVLLRGVLTVVTEQDETLQLKAGDPIIEVVNKWHYGRNDGAETAVIIVFYVGTADLALTVKP
jgi:quercetin dioxygenase-like cupin family protein